ncbi:alpha/beta fold hydrolase [Streptomyces sp. NPDC004685]
MYGASARSSGSRGNVRSAQVTPGGARLRWVEIPGGLQRPPVYLHGFGASSSPYIADVAVHPALAGSRSHLIDMLGFGISDRPTTFGYALEDHADTLSTAHEAAGVWGAEVVGHSMGGAGWPEALHRGAVHLVRGTESTIREPLLNVTIPRTCMNAFARETARALQGT